MRPNKNLLALVILILIVIVGWTLYLIITLSTEDVDQKKNIIISGSGSGMSILEKIGGTQPFEDISLLFLGGAGTIDDVKGVNDGSLDLGTAARKMTDEEKLSYPNVQERSFAKDAMVLAVHPDVNVRGLTSDQVKKIFTGEITNWNQVGGDDGIIILLDRSETESSKILLRKYILGESIIRTDAIEIATASLMLDAILETRNSIGQASFGDIKMNDLTIVPLAIDGIVPSVSSVEDGSYVMIREYGILYNKNINKEHVQKYIDYIFSETLSEKLINNYMVPVL
ncbi:MAG: substrate-binding domain-containing protein [bacterium]|nr:substrate-binding domain-containing protein [bacterium]